MINEGNYSKGSSWDKNGEPTLEYDTNSDSDDLWSLNQESGGEVPTICLNIKKIAKMAELDEKETELLLNSCDGYEDVCPFVTFHTEGVDDGYDWDGPVGGWYEESLEVDYIPTDEDLGLSESFEYYAEGEIPDEDIRVVVKKLKDLDYEDNLRDLEYNERDTF